MTQNAVFQERSVCLVLPTARTRGLDREDISCWTEQGKLVDVSPEPDK